MLRDAVKRRRQNLYAYARGRRVSLASRKRAVPSEPAHKPIKPVYIPKFLGLVDAGE